MSVRVGIVEEPQTCRGWAVHNLFFAEYILKILNACGAMVFVVSPFERGSFEISLCIVNLWCSGHCGQSTGERVLKSPLGWVLLRNLKRVEGG